MTRSSLLANGPGKLCIVLWNAFSSFVSWLAYLCFPCCFAASDSIFQYTSQNDQRLHSPPIPFDFVHSRFLPPHPCINFILPCAYILQIEKYTLFFSKSYLEAFWPALENKFLIYPKIILTWFEDSRKPEYRLPEQHIGENQSPLPTTPHAFASTMLTTKDHSWWLTLTIESTDPTRCLQVWIRLHRNLHRTISPSVLRPCKPYILVNSSPHSHL